MEVANELLDRFKSLREDTHKHNQSLYARLSILDKTVVDIEHEIEFSKPDACTMVHIFKELQEALQERRTVKDEIRVTEGVLALMGKKTGLTEIRAAGKDVRSYAPRVLKELDFTNAKTLLISRKAMIRQKAK